MNLQEHEKNIVDPNKPIRDGWRDSTIKKMRRCLKCGTELKCPECDKEVDGGSLEENK